MTSFDIMSSPLQVGMAPTDGTPGFVKCEKADCEMCQFVVPQLAIKSTVTGED